MKKSIFRRWWFWLIVIIVIFGAIGSSGGNDNSTTNSTEVSVPAQTNSESAPAPVPKEKDIWTKAGMYKVGNDITAGEYLIVSDSFIPAYYQVSKDSTGTLDSIISNDNFTGSRYITLADGQYLELRSAKFVSIDKAPIQEPKDGAYQPGMYKVGRDIAAGEYKAIPDANSMAYLEVSKDSKGAMTSIISNDNFDAEKYVTIKDGQYIKINGCKLVK